jgi:ornithine cyclodeaminase/alanine dehydrogenase-like protein (mu-crystallin family)
MTPMSSILYLSRADVEAVGLDMPAVIELVEAGFRERAAGRVDMPPKLGLSPHDGGFLHAMPAALPGLDAAGMKWVGGSVHNRTKALPYISGLIVLNDVETCLPCSIMDGTWITAQRTGAATAVAARRLARPESATVGILACGVQGRTNLRALATVFPVRRVYAFDIDWEARVRFAAEMRHALQLEVIGVADPRDAVASSDLVVTSGPLRKEPRPTIDAGWLPPGAFVSAVDYDGYWTRDALAEFDRIVTDDLGQFAAYRAQGYFQRMRAPDCDLAALVTGAAPGRYHARERTMAMNLGVALEDVVVAREIDRRARAMGLGTWLSP